MSDQLDLAIVLKAVLDAKGFEDAQGKLQALADKANTVRPAVDGLDKSQKGLLATQEISAREVKILTAELLRSVGATEGAGAAGRLAAVSLTALSDSAHLVNLALASTGFAVAFVIPEIIKWIASQKDLNKEQEESAKKLVDALPELEQYAEKVKKVSDAIKIQLAASRAQALEDDIKKQRVLNDGLAGQEAQLKKTSAEVAKLDEIMSHSFGSFQEAPKALRDRFLELTEAEATQRNELNNNRGALLELNDAISKGISVAEMRAQAVKKATKDTKDETAADKEKAKQLAATDKWIKDSTEASERGEDERIAKRNKTDAELRRMNQEESRREMQQAEEDATRRAKELEQLALIEQRLTYYDLARMKRKHDGSELDKRIADAHRIQTADEIANYAAATQSINQAFGKNKAIAIAAAIADTYAAATEALGMKPWTPANFALATAVIAAGLANVVQIRKASPVGFDDPFNDIRAQKLGRKSAGDFLHYFDAGWQQGLGGRGGGGMAGTTVYDQRTIHSGDTHTHNYGGIHGLMATSAMQFARGLDRAQNKSGRYRKRTTVGRSGS